MKRAALTGVATALTLLTATEGAAGAAPGGAPAPPTAAAQAGVTATVLIDPLRVAVRLGATQVRAGTVVLALAIVRNGGATNLSGAAAMVKPVAGLAVLPRPTRSIGSLAAGGTKTVFWWLCAPAPGTYPVVVAASAQGASPDAFAAYSQPRTLRVAPGRARCPGS